MSPLLACCTFFEVKDGNFVCLWYLTSSTMLTISTGTQWVFIERINKWVSEKHTVLCWDEVGEEPKASWKVYNTTRIRQVPWHRQPVQASEQCQVNWWVNSYLLLFSSLLFYGNERLLPWIDQITLILSSWLGNCKWPERKPNVRTNSFGDVLSHLHRRLWGYHCEYFPHKSPA